MPVTMTTSGLEDVLSWADGLTATFKQAAGDAVLTEATQGATNVDMVMPVDTGWASMRFGDPAVEGGVFEVSDDGLSIEFGSDLSMFNLYEYIIRLNEGSSQQAPAGFIDVEAERTGDRLETRLDNIADTVG